MVGLKEIAAAPNHHFCTCERRIRLSALASAVVTSGRFGSAVQSLSDFRMNVRATTGAQFG